MKASSPLGVAIIGCGLVGQKRSKNLGSARLILCADLVRERAEALAKSVSGAAATIDCAQAIERQDVDIVVIATRNNALAELTLAAIQAGKHVLVEKPAARRVNELQPVLEADRKSDRLVRVGFNHRYHPAVRKARSLFEADVLGEMMFIRGRYGHGGRVGYETEWRADPELSGGGEMIDQGVHLIDLARWFMGEFNDVSGFAHTYFWNMPVDDNGFMLLKTPRQQVAFLHVSCTEWKNLFSLELYGRRGKLHIEGLGGSYGVERLTYYKMRAEMGPPETTSWEYPRPDDSWLVEFEEFLDDIRLGRSPAANLEDARASLAIVEQICGESRGGQSIPNTQRAQGMKASHHSHT